MRSYNDPLPAGEDAQRPSTWHQCPKVQRAHREALDRMLDLLRDVDYAGHTEPDGVVMIGGGAFWLMNVLSAMALRDAGYAGPIQLWHGHRASDEPVDASMVAGLDVEIVSTLAHAERTKPRILRGWEAKVYAVKHCKFKRVLMLDADAYCVNDITRYWPVVFADECGFAYWQDLPNMEGNLKWSIVYEQPAKVPAPVQGGHLFIDRELAWHYLLLVDWLCQHSDFYFQHGYGDQDCFRLALSLIDDIRYRNLGQAQWEHPAFVCSIDSNPVIVHRCQGKLWPARDAEHASTILASSNPKLPLERTITGWYKRLHGLAEDDWLPTQTTRQHRVEAQRSSNSSGAVEAVAYFVAAWLRNTEHRQHYYVWLVQSSERWARAITSAFPSAGVERYAVWQSQPVMRDGEARWPDVIIADWRMLSQEQVEQLRQAGYTGWLVVVAAKHEIPSVASVAWLRDMAQAAMSISGYCIWRLK